jgi:hypothetical protein
MCCWIGSIQPAMSSSCPYMSRKTAEHVSEQGIADISQSVEHLSGLFREEVAAGTPASRIVLAGFDQVRICVHESISASQALHQACSRRCCDVHWCAVIRYLPCRHAWLSPVCMPQP